MVTVKGLAFSAADTVKYSGTTTAGTLSVMNGAAVVLTLNVIGDATKASFAVSGTGSQIVITDQATTPAVQVAGLVAAAAGFGAPAGSGSGHGVRFEPAAQTLLARPPA